MSDDVSAGLHELAAAAPVFHADLPALVRVAARRRRRRTVLRVLAGVAATAALATAGSVLAADGADRLVVPADPDPGVSGEPVPPSPVPSPVPSAVPPSPVPSPVAGPSSDAVTRTVDVYFSPASAGGSCERVRAVAREVSREAPLRPALQALFAGPTAAERAAGSSGFAAPGLLRSVRLADGRAYVDLRRDLFPPNAGTACGGAAFLAQLEATVQGVTPGADVVAALDGDPRAFVEAQQGSCPQPPTAGDRCDPASFR